MCVHMIEPLHTTTTGPNSANYLIHIEYICICVGCFYDENVGLINHIDCFLWVAPWFVWKWYILYNNTPQYHLKLLFLTAWANLQSEMMIASTYPRKQHEPHNFNGMIVEWTISFCLYIYKAANSGNRPPSPPPSSSSASHYIPFYSIVENR